MMSRSSLGAKSVGLPVMLMFLLVGCGGEGDGFTGTRGEVTGKVTFEGRPVPEGTKILFQSTAGKHTYTATGTINATGEYALQYNGSPQLPGVTYEVQLHPPTSISASAPDPVAAVNVSLKAEAPPFPAKYSTSSKNLTFTVKEGKNTADFELTK